MKYAMIYKCRICDKLLIPEQQVEVDDLVEKLTSGEVTIQHKHDSFYGGYWSVRLDRISSPFTVQEEIEHVEYDHYGIADFAGFTQLDAGPEDMTNGDMGISGLD